MLELCQGLVVGGRNRGVLAPGEVCVGVGPMVGLAAVDGQDHEAVVADAVGDVAHVRFPQSAAGEDVVHLQLQVLGMLLRVGRVNLELAALDDIEHEVRVIGEKARIEGVWGVGGVMDNLLQPWERKAAGLRRDALFGVALQTED